MTERGLGRFAASRGATAPGRDAPREEPGQAPPQLGRFLSSRTPSTPGEACEMCATPVPDDHRHVVDLERRGLLCVCQGCSLLFMGAGAADGRYRTVPDRYLRVEDFSLPPQAWAALQIPVGVAFVVGNSKLDRTVAFYPSPGGATESELPLEAWSDIVAANPGLEQAEPDVEAVLVRADAGEPSCFVVPVDRCYELVGLLRMHWRGFDGGQEVREHLSAFFADVARRCTRRNASAPDRSPAHPPRSSAEPLRRSAEVGEDA